MEYQEQAVGRDYAVAPDEPYLARIGQLASEVENSVERILEFIDRCRGGGRIEGKGTGTRPVASGHFAQIDRLQETVIVLDKLTREIGTIG